MSEFSARHRLDRPALLVLFGELLACVAAGWGAYVCWSAAIGTIVVRLQDGTELVSRTYAGHWVGSAIGLGMLAAALLMHAVYRSTRGRGRHNGGITPAGHGAAVPRLPD